MSKPLNYLETNSDIDWDFILETIRDGKCIIFTGPEVFTDLEDQRIEDKLATFLFSEANNEIQTYYQKDHLFLFSSRSAQTKTFYKIKNFYANSFSEASYLYKKIAEIPFHLIINTTLDKYISQVFLEAGLKHRFQYYWKKKAPDSSFKIPTAHAPLIYNMLGSIESQESTVLTHNDLFEYLESVFSGNSMPEQLKLHLKTAKNFLFLGIPFEKWYMQILLRVLYIHNDYDFVKYASNMSIGDELKAFCLEQFHIEFVPNKIREFIDELHSRCKNAGLLRNLDQQSNQESGVDRIIDLLAEDRIDEVLNELKDYLLLFDLEDSELMDGVVLVSNKYNRLNKRIYQGLIDDKEAMLQSNVLRKELLELLKEAKTLE